jgi:hypothetical protein
MGTAEEKALNAESQRRKGREKQNRWENLEVV